MKVSELEGDELNWWVAKAEGVEVEFFSSGPFIGLELMTKPKGFAGRVLWLPSSNWSQGGPIIERESGEIRPGVRTKWIASMGNEMSRYSMYGSTPLVAAMRAYVASKFGDEVPEEP